MWFLPGMDDTLSVSRKEFPGGGSAQISKRIHTLTFPHVRLSVCVAGNVHSSATY